MRFEKIIIPPGWQESFTKYPNGKTIFEALSATITTVNEGIEEVNQKVNQGLLAIEQAENTIRDEITESFNTLKLQLEDEISSLSIDLLSEWSLFQNTVNAQLAEKVQNFKISNEIVNGDFSQGLINYDRKQNSALGTIESLDIIDFKTSPQSAKWTQNNDNQYWVYDIPANINDKMYVSVDIKRNTTAGLFRGWTNNYLTFTGLTTLFDTVSNNLWTRYTAIKTLSENGLSFVLGNGTGTTGSINIDNLLIINLTNTFGAGNEPTKLEMDELMKVIPNQWWDGEITLTQKQFITWQLNLIRKNTNAIIALGGTII